MLRESYLAESLAKRGWTERLVDIAFDVTSRNLYENAKAQVEAVRIAEQERVRGKRADADIYVWRFGIRD